MVICDSDKCCGCGLCEYICPQKAISLSIIGLHYVPCIDEQKCVKCGKCYQNCPVNFPIQHYSARHCYAAWSKDEKVHYECTSGGVATELYKGFIKRGGYIVGCKYDEKLNVRYVVTNDFSDLDKIKGSKYVSSLPSRKTFSKIVELISKGIDVLFIGMPCHCAALRKIVQNNNHLYIIDLLCRGASSPKVFREYIDEQEKKIGKISNVTFRGGDNDCTICLWGKNGELFYRGAQYEDEYFFTFMKHSVLRPSCFFCQYAHDSRVGDITLGDFWGLDAYFLKENHLCHGVNLVLVNTERGAILFDELSYGLEVYTRPLSEAIAGNDTLKEPTPKPKDYELITSKCETIGFIRTIHEYDNEYIQIRKRLNWNRTKEKIKKVLPSFVLSVYRAIRKW